MKLTVVIQRIEGLVIFLGAIYIFYLRGGSWLVGILVFLAIDLTMVGYTVNNKIGAYVYNLGHTFVVPSIIYIFARYFDNSLLSYLSLVWFAHISLDRALGYGLKYESGFKDTHLGTIGR